MTKQKLKNGITQVKHSFHEQHVALMPDMAVSPHEQVASSRCKLIWPAWPLAYLGRLCWIVLSKFHGYRIEASLPICACFPWYVAFPLHQVNTSARVKQQVHGLLGPP